jgi:hypothetical protein
MKSVLRIALMLMLVITTSFCFSYDNAQAASIDDLTKIYNSATQGGKEYFCKKAKASSGIYSVRSFEGFFCSNDKTIAALSQYVCTNPAVLDFKGSNCDEKGLKTLGGANPSTVLKDALTKNLGFPYQNLINLFFKG